MNTGIVALLALLLLVLTVVGLIWWIRFVLRRHRAGQQQMQQPKVPGTAPLPAGPPGRKHLRRRAAFTARLATGAPTWAQPSEVHLSIPEINQTAGAHGYTPARALGAPADPMLLFTRTPIRHLTDVLDPAARKPLPSWSRHLVGLAVLFGGLVLIMLPLGVARSFDASVAVWLPLSLIPLAMLVGGALLPLRHTLVDTSTRMTMLINEFTGRPELRVLPHHYAIDVYVVAAVAAEMGYRYVRSRHGWRTSSRWNETWIDYARDPGRRPMELS